MPWTPPEDELTTKQPGWSPPADELDLPSKNLGVTEPVPKGKVKRQLRLKGEKDVPELQMDPEQAAAEPQAVVPSAPVPTPSLGPPTTSQAGAAAMGGAQGLTGGFSDELIGLLNSAKRVGQEVVGEVPALGLKPDQGSPSQSYAEGRDWARDYQKRASGDWPWTYYGSELLAGLAPQGEAIKLAKGAGMGAVAAGTALGGLSALGHSEAPMFSTQQGLEVLLGAGAGLGLSALGARWSKGVEAATPELTAAERNAVLEGGIPGLIKNFPERPNIDPAKLAADAREEVIAEAKKQGLGYLRELRSKYNAPTNVSPNQLIEQEAEARAAMHVQELVQEHASQVQQRWGDLQRSLDVIGKRYGRDTAEKIKDMLIKSARGELPPSAEGQQIQQGIGQEVGQQLGQAGKQLVRSLKGVAYGAGAGYALPRIIPEEMREQIENDNPELAEFMKYLPLGLAAVGAGIGAAGTVPGLAGAAGKYVAKMAPHVEDQLVSREAKLLGTAEPDINKLFWTTPRVASPVQPGLGSAAAGLQPINWWISKLQEAAKSPNGHKQVTLMDQMLQTIPAYKQWRSEVIKQGRAHNVQGRAGGGQMLPGAPYVVGEEGPEIVIPKAPSFDLPKSSGGPDKAVTDIVHKVQDKLTENPLGSKNGMGGTSAGAPPDILSGGGLGAGTAGMGDLGGAAAGGEGMLSGLMEVAPLALAAAEDGGPIEEGQPTLVGEDGPEVVVPGDGQKEQMEHPWATPEQADQIAQDHAAKEGGSTFPGARALQSLTEGMEFGPPRNRIPMAPESLKRLLKSAKTSKYIQPNTRRVLEGLANDTTRVLNIGAERTPIVPEPPSDFVMREQQRKDWLDYIRPKKTGGQGNPVITFDEYLGKAEPKRLAPGQGSKAHWPVERRKRELYSSHDIQANELQKILDKMDPNDERFKNIRELLEKLKKREDGGPVEAGEPVLVGEDGPETVVPDQGGSTVPGISAIQKLTEGMDLVPPKGPSVKARQLSGLLRMIKDPETDPGEALRLKRLLIDHMRSGGKFEYGNTDLRGVQRGPALIPSHAPGFQGPPAPVEKYDFKQLKQLLREQDPNKPLVDEPPEDPKAVRDQLMEGLAEFSKGKRLSTPEDKWSLGDRQGRPLLVPPELRREFVALTPEQKAKAKKMATDHENFTIQNVMSYIGSPNVMHSFDGSQTHIIPPELQGAFHRLNPEQHASLQRMIDEGVSPEDFDTYIRALLGPKGPKR